MSSALIGLIGLLIGFLLNTFKDLLFERDKRDRIAKYVAVKVICQFDKFVEQAATVTFDNGIEDENGIVIDDEHPNPDTPNFSDELDWRTIDPELMYKVMIFPSQVERANNFIEHIFIEEATKPDLAEGFEERHYQYAKLGIVAAEISDELRTKYGLPDRKVPNWNPVDRLTKIKTEIENKRRERR